MEEQAVFNGQLVGFLTRFYRPHLSIREHPMAPLEMDRGGNGRTTIGSKTAQLPNCPRACGAMRTRMERQLAEREGFDFFG